MINEKEQIEILKACGWTFKQISPYMYDITYKASDNTYTISCCKTHKGFRTATEQQDKSEWRWHDMLYGELIDAAKYGINLIGDTKMLVQVNSRLKNDY